MSEDSQVENCNGFRFCKDCGRLCIPLYAGSEPNTMIFKCDICKERRSYIDPKQKEGHIIKKTQVLQSEAADIKHRALGEDPSMPRRDLFCRKCQEQQQVVYYYKAGNEEKNILIQFICPTCGFSWTSDDLSRCIQFKCQKRTKEGKDKDLVDYNQNEDDDDYEGDQNSDNQELFGYDKEFLEESESGRDLDDKINDKENSFDIFGEDDIKFHAIQQKAHGLKKQKQID